jgi:hypothetical protein
MVGDWPTDLRMRVLQSPKTKFDGVHVSLTGNQRMAVVQARRHDGYHPERLRGMTGISATMLFHVRIGIRHVHCGCWGYA